MHHVVYILFFAFFLFIARPSFSDKGGWAATYGGADNDFAECIQQTSDGGYIVAGEANSFGAGDEDSWVLKLGPDGDVDEYDEADSIQQTSDGGYVVVGETKSFSAGGSDLWVLKLKPDGSIDGSYDFVVRNTRIWVGLSIATVNNTRVNPRNSSANLRESQATVLDTGVSAKFLVR